MKRLALAFVCLSSIGLLNGCGVLDKDEWDGWEETQQFPSAYQVQLSPELLPYEETINKSFQQWEEKTGVVFNITITNDDCSAYKNGCLQIVASTRAQLEETYKEKAGGHTIRRWNRSFIEIATDLQYNQPECVMLHEVGHALGLKHSEDVDSIMYYSWTIETLPIVAAVDVRTYKSLR